MTMPDSTGWSRAAEEAIKQQPVYAREVLVAARENDPDTTLEGEAFVDHAVENTGDDTFLSDVSVVDVFAVVAAYDHEVGSQTAPEFDTYEHAQDAGIALLLTNANVLHFRIEKRTRIA